MAKNEVPRMVEVGGVTFCRLAGSTHWESEISLLIDERRYFRITANSTCYREVKFRRCGGDLVRTTDGYGGTSFLCTRCMAEYDCVEYDGRMFVAPKETA